jgi:hypothetical protein
VSAAAVIPALRVVWMFIGPKASVAGLASPLLNPPINRWIAGDTARLGDGRGRRYFGVGVKSYNPGKTTSGEGCLLERARR